MFEQSTYYKDEKHSNIAFNNSLIIFVNWDLTLMDTQMDKTNGVKTSL
ncbi:hypothetical protein GAMM_10110 [Gammaproteobacteria bacterium]